MSTTLAIMVNIVDRDTILCISLAARPSNHGVRFHNWLYAELGLNYLYKAVAPTSIEAAITGMRGLAIRGAGVSMPYKSDVIALIDELDPSAARIRSVNTIVNTDGHLKGYNTDYIAVAELLKNHNVDPKLNVAIRGSGGMANAVVAALSDFGMTGTVVARNHDTGSALAGRYGWKFSEDVPADAELLVNVTPMGMYGDTQDQLAFTETQIQRAKTVFDVVAYPVQTPLIKAATRLGIPTINGGEVVALQAAEQFALYTGIRPTDAQVMAAEEYSQQN